MNGNTKMWRAARVSAMRPPMMSKRTPAAGGIFLFLGPIIGALYGIGRGQPILWMLVGFGAGIALAILVWLVDRVRR
jgi:hypothetical protein